MYLKKKSFPKSLSWIMDLMNPIGYIMKVTKKCNIRAFIWTKHLILHLTLEYETWTNLPMTAHPFLGDLFWSLSQFSNNSTHLLLFSDLKVRRTFKKECKVQNDSISDNCRPTLLCYKSQLKFKIFFLLLSITLLAYWA